MRGLGKVFVLGGVPLLLCSAATLCAQQPAPPERPAAPDTVVLSGGFGSVTFAHATHEKMTRCVNCHHDSRPEKPLEAGFQKCGDCHGKTAIAPMKTSIRAAFHDAKARTGTCMDCHVARSALWQGVPVTCKGCHFESGADKH